MCTTWGCGNGTVVAAAKNRANVRGYVWRDMASQKGDTLVWSGVENDRHEAVAVRRGRVAPSVSVQGYPIPSHPRKERENR